MPQETTSGPLLIYEKTWASPLIPESEVGEDHVKERARRGLLADLAAHVKSPGMYFVQLEERTIPENGFTHWEEYRVTIRVWEKS